MGVVWWHIRYIRYTTDTVGGISDVPLIQRGGISDISDIPMTYKSYIPLTNIRYSTDTYQISP